MEQIMHIGAKVAHDDAVNLSKAIATVFESAYECHMEQDTTRQALDVIKGVFEVKNITVTNSNFVGEDKRVIVDTKELF
jgi:hypothetical protein